MISKNLLRLCRRNVGQHFARAFSTSIKECDYLVVGGGAVGMAFTDELMTQRPDAKVVLVDNRPAVGGHWNSAYDFVGLHQPAAFYGVNSIKLEKTEDQDILNDLSTKPELLNYFKTACENL
jgi:cation diffusion facilitator CzcD-associated flavoprotein CzcO